MSHAIHQRKMNKEQAKILRKILDQSVSNDEVTIIDVGKYVGAGGFGKLPQFFLANIHDGLQPRRMGQVEEIRTDGEAPFRKIIIPVHAMLGRTHASQHGSMGHQRDAWKNSLGMKRIS